jgi:osmotically-inducible protein OsmY
LKENTMEKTDTQLKKDIEEELRWDPKLNAAQIGVSVDKGVVTLLGAVDSYGEKFAAEDATKRVSGVRTVAQDLTVKVLDDYRHSDADLANAAQNALKWDVFVPDTVLAVVSEGSITLSGTVTWKYERDAAEKALRNLAGVVAVYNTVTVTPKIDAVEVREKVEAALQRQATRDGQSIRIQTSGGKVTLTGHASSWESIENASDAAWAAPGVTEVVDEVTVSARM